MFRSHGMVRESKNELLNKKYKEENSSLNPEFIFAYPAYNVRNTEIGAIIGRNQLKYLDSNIEKRNNNHTIFLNNIDKSKYRTDFLLEGSSNYAFNLIFKEADNNLVNQLIKKMDSSGIEYRRGSAGGGNQIRQPYLKKFIKPNYWLNFPQTEHVHFYGLYLGNYPDLNDDKILELCSIINDI
jgi:CDP-6-deoxy-D-xylo-4-hexulose-3-dehydrase